MQKLKLPLTVDPVKDAQQRIDYDGYYTASQLVRLAESTGKVLSDAQVTLSFYIDPQKLVVMKGQVQVDVESDCQRCGEPFKQTLGCHFMYSPVANWDQADDFAFLQVPSLLIFSFTKSAPVLGKKCSLILYCHKIRLSILLAEEI